MKIQQKNGQIEMKKKTNTPKRFYFRHSSKSKSIIINVV